MKIVNKNKAISESFANNLDKDILDIIKANEEQINYVKQGKCSKSSGYNILKAYNDPNTKEIKLVVGHLRPNNGKDELPTSTITHMWVEVDGDIYATNEPSGFERIVDDSLVIDKSKDLYSQVKNFLKSTALQESLLKESILDSKGNNLTNEQASFFKDSKVRGREGNLLVCYHGSNEDFDEFKWELIGSGNHSKPNVGLFGKGFYFSNYEDTASHYGNVKAYYLNIKNPFVYANYRDGESAQKIVKDTGLNFNTPYSSYYEDTYLSFLDTIEDQTNFTNYLIEKGYDGIIASDPHTPNDLEIVAFNSNQIKLVTNTNPTTSNKVNESLLESQNEIVKDKTGREFNIWTESTGGYGDQHDWMKIAYLGDNWLDDNDRIIRDNLLGFLEYATDDEDNCYVQMIQVKDTEKRKGIASQLIKSLQKEYKNINYGFTTEEGTQLLKGLGIRENLLESNYGYHAGDLGKSEYYGQQSSGRGTGHFGTGTYFVGDPNKIKGYNDYNYGKGEAPHHIVDFSSYNLYKPSTNQKGYALHDALKVLDGSYTYWKDKVDDINIIKKYEGKDKRKYDNFTEDELEELIGALNRLDSDEEPLDVEYFSTFLVPNNFDKYYDELVITDLDTAEAWEDQSNLMEKLYDKVQEWTDWRVLTAIKDVSNIENKLYQALEGRVSVSRIRQGLNDVVEAQKRYEASRDRKVDSLATVFMKSLGYEGIDTRHLNKDDTEQALAGLDNTGYGSVIYDVKPNTIVEAYEGKTFVLPRGLVDKCIDYYKDTYPTISVEKLPIDQLVKDNNLLDDEDLQSYHQRQWDNKSAKEFSINQDKINSMRVSEVPFVVKKKDKLDLVDGRHRIRALYNDGYSYVELPVVEESLTEGLNEEVDSEGNQLTQEQINFFRNSKVRDNQGKLLVCYHGSKSSFDTFDKSKIKPWGWYGKGFYFTPNQNVANNYSEGHMIICYLNITNPFYADSSFTNKEEYYNRCDKLYELVGITKEEIDKQDEECRYTSDPYYKLLMYLTHINSSKDINDYVKELGYDGVIGLDSEGEEQELIIFEPNQIKAITNKTPSNSDNINEVLEDNLDEDVNRSFPEWQFGAKSFAKAFPQEDIEYMDNHQTVSSYPLYRCNTIEGSYKVGDTITFDRYRSFSKGAQGFNATLENVGVYFSPEECWCMQTRGKISYFDATKVVNSILYQHQKEVLVKGTFKVVDITTFHSKDTEEDWPMYVVEQIDNGLEESLTEDKDTVEFLYHGSPSPTLNLERDSTLWLAEDYDYALGFGDYIHICSAHLPNILEVGNTDGYIRGLIPTQFSKEFIDLANKVGMQPKELLRACGEDCKNIYSLVRTKQFRKICMEKGYDAVETEEFGNICYGVFNRHNVELIDTEGIDEEPTPMDESKLDSDNGHQEVTDEPLNKA